VRWWSRLASITGRPRAAGSRRRCSPGFFHQAMWTHRRKHDLGQGSDEPVGCVRPQQVDRPTVRLVSRSAISNRDTSSETVVRAIDSRRDKSLTVCSCSGYSKGLPREFRLGRGAEDGEQRRRSTTHNPMVFTVDASREGPRRVVRPEPRARAAAPPSPRPCPAGCCRSRTWATARRTGNHPGTRRPRSRTGSRSTSQGVPSARARRNRRHRGARRRRTRWAARCRRAVPSTRRRYPTGHRSRTAAGGRWRRARRRAGRPGRSTNSSPVSATSNSSRVYQTALVTSSLTGMSSGVSSRISPLNRRRW